MILWKIIFIIFLFVRISNADYPAAKRNQDLCKETENQPYRLIPKNEFFCATADGNVFIRAIGAEDFYHGLGHWTQVRTEITPNPHTKINTRSIFYSGSSSQGYAQPTGFYTLFSVSTILPEKILGATFSARVIDLDRQTYGAGLFVDQKESIGGIFKLDYNTSQFMIRHDSTGLFLMNDDVWNLETRFFDKTVGLGTVIFNTGGQGGATYVRKPYHYLFAAIEYQNWDLQTEVGERNKQFAGMISAKNKFSSGRFSLTSKLQARRYSAGFGTEITGLIENQYVSYDQYDKPFVTPMTILRESDDISVYSVHFATTYEFNSVHQVQLNNEFAQYDYKILRDKILNFYRLEYIYSPIENRKESIAFFVSNKVLSQSQSYFRPPTGVAVGQDPLFRELNFLGIEGNFSF